MRNNLFLINLLISLFFSTNLFANNLEISSSEIRLDKKDSKMLKHFGEKVPKKTHVWR